MKLQIAIDRLCLADLLRIAEQVEPAADVIEIGTSLIKEYGVTAVRQLRALLPRAVLFADTKIVDEARYEAELYIQAGADQFSVMGTAPLETIQTALTCARAHQRKLFVDLMETPDEKIRKLQAYHDVIFGIHLAKDQTGDLSSLVQRQVKLLPKQAVLAAAGGIAVSQIGALAASGIEQIIVGSAVVQAEDPYQTAMVYRKEMERYEHDPNDR